MKEARMKMLSKNNLYAKSILRIRIEFFFSIFFVVSHSIILGFSHHTTNEKKKEFSWIVSHPFYQDVKIEDM